MVYEIGSTILGAKVVNKCGGAWLDHEARCWRKWSRAKVLDGPWEMNGTSWYDIEFRDGSRGTFDVEHLRALEPEQAGVG
jgi:hypothetical protein